MFYFLKHCFPISYSLVFNYRYMLKAAVVICHFDRSKLLLLY